jgi:AcrR family transcriptional regulator
MSQRRSRARAPVEIPPALAQLWRPAERVRRRPRSLERERIVAAAVSLADREGLGGLSMASLAQRLRCAPMSLYRHVADKDELLLLMLDAAPGAPPAARGARRDWRGGLEGWARALQRVYRRHPWVLDLSAGRPPLDPGQLAWLEAGLRTLAVTRLAPGDRFAVAMAVLYFVRGHTQTLGAGARGPAARGAAPGADYGRLLDALLDPGRFPALRELLAAGAFDARAGGRGAAGFAFGLGRLLDGVEALVRAAAGRGPGPGPRRHRRPRR